MQGQPKQSQQEQSKQGQRDQGMQGQPKQGQTPRDQTTGQAPRDQSENPPKSQREQHDQTQGQRPQRDQTQSGQVQQTPAPQGQPQQGQAQQGQASGTVNLTADQRVRVQQTVLARSDLPRVNNVNFALSVGTVVPASVRIVDVDPAFVEIFPQFRGHRFFVVRDDIVIIDQSRKIVSVVPVGSSAQGGAQFDTGHGAAQGGGAAVLNLGSEQIREVQTMLIQKGFDINEANGVLDQPTIEALIAFQRQQGFEATGQIDNQTVSALGLSNLSGQQGGATQSTTTGQGGAGAQQPPANQNMGSHQGNQDGNRPSTTGQGGGKMQRPIRTSRPRPVRAGRKCTSRRPNRMLAADKATPQTVRLASRRRAIPAAAADKCNGRRPRQTIWPRFGGASPLRKAGAFELIQACKNVASMLRSKTDSHDCITSDEFGRLAFTDAHSSTLSTLAAILRGTPKARAIAIACPIPFSGETRPRNARYPPRGW